MAIVSTDLVFYGSQYMPEDNSSNMGGLIDTTTKVTFTDIAATDAVEILSSSGSDTSQTVTITGRNAAGEIVSEIENLDGTNVQITSQTFERILKIVMNTTAVGTVTVRRATGDTTIATLEPGLTSVRRLFYDSAAEASTGSSRDFYEKVFLKNNHGTLTLTNSLLSEYSDPSTYVEFAVESGYNGSGYLGTRLNLEPSGCTSFDSADKYVSNSGLPAGSGQGIFLKLTLAAGTAPSKNTYSLQIDGTST